MIFKGISLFLVAMVALALFGRVRLGGLLPGGSAKTSLKKPVKCKSCGRFLIGKGPCDCGAPSQT